MKYKCEGIILIESIINQLFYTVRGENGVRILGTILGKNIYLILRLLSFSTTFFHIINYCLGLYNV